MSSCHTDRHSKGLKQNVIHYPYENWLMLWKQILTFFLFRYDWSSCSSRWHWQFNQTGSSKCCILQGLMEITISTWKHKETAVSWSWWEDLPSSHVVPVIHLPLRWVQLLSLNTLEGVVKFFSFLSNWRVCWYCDTGDCVVMKASCTGKVWVRLLWKVALGLAKCLPYPAFQKCEKHEVLKLRTLHVS